MASGLENVYVAKDVDLTVSPGGWHPPVSSVSLELREGGIPRAFLLVDPSHVKGAPSNPATVATIYDVKLWLDKAQDIAADPKSRANLMIKIVDGQGNDVQSIQLNGWLVVAAGMAGVSANGRFALEIELQHPAGLLDRSVANLGNIKDETLDWSSDSYANPLQGISEAYKTWAKAERVASAQLENTCAQATGGVSPDDVITKIKEQLQAKAGDIMKYLQWTTSWPENNAGYSNLPFEKSCFEQEQQALKAALNSYATDFGESSIWSMLVNVLCPEWQLTIVPTYWKDQLEMMPMSPWSYPVIEVYDDEISSISFPGVDAAPIGGARIPFSPSQLGMDTSYMMATQDHESQKLAGEVLYIPEGAMSGEGVGRIIAYGTPSWLLTAANAESSRAGADTESGKHETSGLTTTENIDEDAPPPSGAGTEGLDAAGHFAGALFGVANQIFLSAYRAQVEASFATCLLFKSEHSKWPEQYVIPGCVVRVKTRGNPGGGEGGGVDGGDIVLFDMYLTSVTHTYDADNSTASTLWSGSYCRPEGGITGIIPGTTYNPMYL